MIPVEKPTLDEIIQENSELSLDVNTFMNADAASSGVKFPQTGGSGLTKITINNTLMNAYTKSNVETELLMISQLVAAIKE